MVAAQVRLFPRLAAMAWLAVVWSGAARVCDAQFVRNGAVGGVKVDVDGVISQPELGDLRELQSAWQRGLEPVPADLQKPAEIRFVSLRSLEAEAAKALDAGKPLPDSVRYLAGLQRIRYVFVYPEQKDIVLAGPAEGWKINARGSVVGATSGRPVIQLDDLLVALRVAESSNATGISCSIDPTPEGLQRLAQLGPLRAGTSPQVAARQQEEAAGNQKISVTGVPETSHFARVIVAADFRMKRLAMDFEPAPVDGMPSYMNILASRRAASNFMAPRFWLAPQYEPVRRDEGGMAWELRGQGVKCLTEAQSTSSGAVERTGKADPLAQQWADSFTTKFDELAREDSAFGELRNVMDLAVVTALAAKERLFEKAGLDIARLRNDVAIEEFHAPRSVPSQASFVRMGRGWVISVSGGVQIYPWQVADKTEVSNTIAAARPTRNESAGAWYWQK
jgi:hypothetical protein